MGDKSQFIYSSSSDSESDSCLSSFSTSSSSSGVTRPCSPPRRDSARHLHEYRRRSLLPSPPRPRQEDPEPALRVHVTPDERAIIHEPKTGSHTTASPKRSSHHKKEKKSKRRRLNDHQQARRSDQVAETGKTPMTLTVTSIVSSASQTDGGLQCVSTGTQTDDTPPPSGVQHHIDVGRLIESNNNLSHELQRTVRYLSGLTQGITSLGQAVHTMTSTTVDNATRQQTFLDGLSGMVQSLQISVQSIPTHPRRGGWNGRGRSGNHSRRYNPEEPGYNQ